MKIAHFDGVVWFQGEVKKGEARVSKLKILLKLYNFQNEYSTSSSLFENVVVHVQM